MNMHINHQVYSLDSSTKLLPISYHQFHLFYH
nr:MAG TPA: hypothetical protein [Bacteriophage sp.]